ncbi:caspase domain-containing protein [Streptomyces sp. NPDC058221]|uniref:caspase family protein n=1 Tax=Streptomyces sp. NPDC058221 TaxID=3346388 RepID=UPI0036F037DC
MHADPRYRGLLIGNASFPSDPHALPELRGPLVDLKELGQALTDDKVGLFSPGNILSLPDKEVHELRKNLDKFFSTAMREDVLLLYYSGHGRLDEYGELYLCASDTMLDTPRATALSAAEINNMIRSSAAATVVIVLDCCHSGAWKADVDLAAPVAGKGRYVLTSNRSTQLARDAEAEGQPSPFTEMLVRGLRHAEAAGHLTVSELYRQVHHWMTEGSPRPPQLSFIGEGDIAIARRGKNRQRKRPHQLGSRRLLAQPQAEQDNKKHAVQIVPDAATKEPIVFEESWTGDENPQEFSQYDDRIGPMAICLVFSGLFIWGYFSLSGLLAWVMIGLFILDMAAFANKADGLYPRRMLRQSMRPRTLRIDEEGITATDASGRQHVPWSMVASVVVKHADTIAWEHYPLALHLNLRNPDSSAPRVLYRPAGWPTGVTLPDVCRGQIWLKADDYVPICILGPMPEPRRVDMKNVIAIHGKISVHAYGSW